MKKYDVIIIGAGASGLVTAIVSARRGKKVLILEKNSKVGKKLLATGNGKCNITNQRPMPDRFYSHNPKFVLEVLEGYGYQGVKNFFKSVGLELIEGKEGKVFPMSLQASSVVEILEAECHYLGVKISCEVDVNKIKKTKKGYDVFFDNKNISAYSVVVSTGHLSAPQLGGVDSGTVFAKHFDHKIFKPFPTLVQLNSHVNNLDKMAGVKVESRVSFTSQKGVKIQKQGDVLFTSYGLSGLAILDISRHVIEELIHTPKVVLEIDLMPKMSREQLLALFKKSLLQKDLLQKDLFKTSPKPLTIWLQGFINKKLIVPILEPLKLENTTVASLLSNKKSLKILEEIVNKIKCFNFQVDGSRGYKGAEVVAGGVDTKEINPMTLESKKHRGLYFTGEVLDVDGDRGGFNLHFAWVCGLRAGQSL